MLIPRNRQTALRYALLSPAGQQAQVHIDTSLGRPAIIVRIYSALKNFSVIDVTAVSEESHSEMGIWAGVR
jgi:hypothetical protein